MAETDEAVRKFLDGEEAAFSDIVQRWEGKVYSLAWRMLGSREDAQDVVQETFLSVFRSTVGVSSASQRGQIKAPTITSCSCAVYQTYAQG